MESTQPDALSLLREARLGDVQASAQLASLLESELRRLVLRHMRLERPGTVLRPSTLLNAAFLEIAGEQDLGWESRARFLGIAAPVLRRVLVAFAREHPSRRGMGPLPVLPLDDELAYTADRSDALLALHRELDRLAQPDPQQARIMELRFFGGLTVEETAEVVGLPPRAVKREWGMARVWLHRAIVARH